MDIDIEIDIDNWINICIETDIDIDIDIDIEIDIDSDIDNIVTDRFTVNSVHACFEVIRCQIQRLYQKSENTFQ